MHPLSYKVFLVAKPELGSKHQCQNCGAKFFDLNKNPIVCPKCGTTFEVASAAAPVRAAPRASKEDAEDESDNDGGAETVSLEDADQPDEGGKVEAAATDEDVEDDDSGDDDAFLEDDEEDDGDVSDLIDGDIEDDEER